MKQLIDYIAEAFEEDVQLLVNYLQGSPSEKVVKAMRNTMRTQEMSSGDIADYIKSCNLNTVLVKQILDSLDEDDATILLDALVKHDSFVEFDPHWALDSYIKWVIKEYTGQEMSQEGINKLIGTTIKSSTISVGPGETAVGLLFSDTARAKDKSDITWNGKKLEFKSNGARIYTTSCKYHIYNVWEHICDKLSTGVEQVIRPDWKADKSEKIEGVKSKPTDNVLHAWYTKNQFDKRKKEFAEILVQEIGGMFSTELNKNLIGDVVDQLKGQNLGEVLIRIAGVLSIIAYQKVEDFNAMAVHSLDKGVYTNCTFLDKFGFDQLWAAPIVFSRPNADDSFGGLVINSTQKAIKQ